MMVMLVEHSNKSVLGTRHQLLSNIVPLEHVIDHQRGWCGKEQVPTILVEGEDLVCLILLIEQPKNVQR
jgi:hypothetical protein